jgi:son of sevenless-like protein
MKTAEVIREIQQYQSAPYLLQPVRELQTFIKAHLENSRDEEILYGLSVALEPK